MSGLVMEHGEGHLVTAVHPHAIQIGGRSLERSFAVTATQLIDDWGPADAAGLHAEHLTRLIDLRPDVILLGTGGARFSLAPALLYPPLASGIGIEVMDNAAAARTYNLLRTEGRNVLAAFILEPGTRR